jgi:hypothetical protein
MKAVPGVVGVLRRRFAGGPVDRIASWACCTVAAAAVAAVAPACDDQSSAVRVVVRTDIDVPAGIDSVTVTVVASRSAEENRLCEPVSRTFPLSSAADFPIAVQMERGEVYTAWVAFRVEGKRGDDTIVAREERIFWPDAGVREIEIVLEAGCVGVACTPGVEQCIRGRCPGVPRRYIFTDPSMRDPDAPCL